MEEEGLFQLWPSPAGLHGSNQESRGVCLRHKMFPLMLAVVFLAPSLGFKCHHFLD